MINKTKFSGMAHAEIVRFYPIKSQKWIDKGRVFEVVVI